jgi:dUTP pyrophosphatase
MLILFYYNPVFCQGQDGRLISRGLTSPCINVPLRLPTGLLHIKMDILDESKTVCRVAGGFTPSYAYPGDAGADLCAAADTVIPARGKMLVSTGIRLALPEGHVGLIWPRSGMAVKHGIDCGAGVIDSQYRGEVKVLLFNHSDGEHFIKQGDRIAQLLVQKVETVEFLPVDDLDATDRSSNGFGSTG